MDTSATKAEEHTRAQQAAILQEVLARYQATPDPRLREIMQVAIRHLHAFVQEARITFPEWEAGMRFFQTAADACKPPRHEFIALSDVLGVTMQVVIGSQAKPPEATTPTLVGPFFVPNAPQVENGADISRGAAGTPLFVSGTVRDTHGRPVKDAAIDVWHSDERGLYDVQDDFPNKGMWARAQLHTDAEGRYAFRTVLPTAYPAPMDGGLGALVMSTTRKYMRPAHLHFALRAEGFDPLVTHLFVKGDKFLDEDVAFGVRPELVVDYPRHEAGRAPDGTVMERPFHTLGYDFVLTTPADRGRHGGTPAA